MNADAFGKQNKLQQVILFWPFGWIDWHTEFIWLCHIQLLFINQISFIKASCYVENEKESRLK